MNRYIVSYDIRDKRRLRKVFQTSRGFGAHAQYSVFLCDLSPVRKVELIGLLGEIINHKEDQVLLIDLGPADGRAERCIEAVGRPFTASPAREVLVV